MRPFVHVFYYFESRMRLYLTHSIMFLEMTKCAMPFLFLFMNVGSLLTNVTPVKRNILNLMYRIQGDVGIFPNAVGFQETNTDTFVFGPKFGLPTCTDSHVNVVPGPMQMRRGVATYTENDATPVSTEEFAHIEASVTIHPYTDFALGNPIPRTKKIAVFNIYRNTHEAAIGNSIVDIKRFIIAMRIKLRQQHDVHDLLICGDFNYEGTVGLNFLTELRDDRLYHRHKVGDSIKKIDRVFTTCEFVEIIDVFPTVENKTQTLNAEGVMVGDDLGHKPCLIRVGRSEKQALTETMFSIKKFQKHAQKWKGALPKTPTTDAEIEHAAEYLIALTQRLQKSSEFTIKNKSRWDPDRAAMEIIDDTRDDTLAKYDASKKFYNIAGQFFGKLKENANKTEPSSESFKVHAEKKLAALIPPDIDECIRIVNEQYRDRPKIELKFPTKQEFRKMIMSSSNSGARDVFGLSLKMTKRLAKFNSRIRDFMYVLYKAMAKNGFVPECFKQDKISYLYKDKGTLDDCAFYRPVTISVSFSKMFERVMAGKWNEAEDFNFGNHAYVKNRSCLSAIAAVQEFFHECREEKVLLKDDEMFIIIVCCEDISSAFESISHIVIKHYCDITYSGDDFKMGDLVKSYLDRKSFIMKNGSEDKFELIRTHLEQTSPQGSSMSPPWWRVYDGAYAHIYKQKLGKIMVENDYIHGFSHASYADDQNTTFRLKVKKDMSPTAIQDLISQTSLLARNALKEATGVFGCSVNPSKSEILVENQYADMKYEPVKLKNEIVWLGYSLENNDHYFTFTKKRMVDKFKNVTEKFDNMMQYIRNIKTKRRVYQVYIAPIIEWFLPVVMTGKINKYKANEIEKFQQSILTRVGNFSGNVSRTGLNKIMGAYSVKDKCYFMAKRLTKYYVRDINELKGWTNTTTTLRSGNIARDRIWKSYNPKDLGDYVHHRIHHHPPANKECFDQRKAKKWIKAANTKIQTKMLEREMARMNLG